MIFPCKAPSSLSCLQRPGCVPSAVRISIGRLRRGSAFRVEQSPNFIWTGRPVHSRPARGMVASSTTSFDSSDSLGGLLTPYEKPTLESPKLDKEVRRRAEKAIESRGYKVTVGDVAATGGITLFQAERATRALATDTQATLQVSDAGEILYCFPTNFRATIQSKSLLFRLEPVVEGVFQAAAYLVRVAFGTTLVVSVIMTTLALLVIASGSKDDRKGGHGQGMSFGAMRGARMGFDFIDLMWYWDPYYYRRRAEYHAAYGRDRDMSFLEAVFSFVLGDGNPNEGYDRHRWEKLGQYIQSRGGVVVAEEMAPYLDVTPEQVERKGAVVDESYVLPALTRLQGSPEVDVQGNILYCFPQLQPTGNAVSLARKAAPKPVLEKPYAVTKAEGEQKLMVQLLGAFNVFAVFSLSSALTNPANVAVLATNGMAWILGLMPFLQAYAAAFFVVPFVRWLINRRLNQQIALRNKARQDAVSAVASLNPALATKLENASKLAQQRVITERDVVYRSDRAVDNQPIDLEGRLFEERLQRRTSEKELL